MTTTTNKTEKNFSIIADACGNLKISDEIIFELYGTPETRRKSRAFPWKGLSWSTCMVIRHDGIGLFFGYSNKVNHKKVGPSVCFHYNLLTADGQLLSKGPEITYDFTTIPRNQRVERLDYGRFGMFPSSLLDKLRLSESGEYCLRFTLEVKEMAAMPAPSIPKPVTKVTKEEPKEHQNLTPIEIEIEGESENEIPSSDSAVIQSIPRPVPPAIPPSSPLAVSTTTQDSVPSNNYQVNTLNIFPKLMNSVFDLKHLSTMELTCIEVQVADYYEEVRKERRKRMDQSSSFVDK